jgi:hypothetical protein
MLIGALVLGVGVIIKNASSFGGVVEQKARVVKVVYRDKGWSGDQHHYPYITTVRYRYQGREYENVTGRYASALSIGSEINILIDPRDPNRIDTRGNTILGPALCFLIGGVFVLLGWHGGPEEHGKCA